MIKAVFFDIDGTLVSFETHRVPESTLNSIKELQAKGIKVFVATGRHPSILSEGNNVKEIADYVTSSVDEDGVYKALKHFEMI
ncbi:HAD hydrolase family protein [Fusobacterium sp.]|uniref:HAD hydrolase family protein n=1 Tax=Fusobacterium sp. TaxID=68766 RepID=UPI0025C4E02D|nr:HAD hydrolase family protein [Fusobacterium sp.]